MWSCCLLPQGNPAWHLPKISTRDRWKCPLHLFSEGTLEPNWEAAITERRTCWHYIVQAGSHPCWVFLVRLQQVIRRHENGGILRSSSTWVSSNVPGTPGENHCLSNMHLKGKYIPLYLNTSRNMNSLHLRCFKKVWVIHKPIFPTMIQKTNKHQNKCLFISISKKALSRIN